MGVKARRIVVLSTLALLPAVVEAQAVASPADFWRGADTLSKLIYLRGVADGAGAGRAQVVRLLQRPALRNALLRDGPEGQVTLDSALTLVTNRYTLLVKRALPVIGVMDKIYLAPENACLPLVVVLTSAVRALDGEAATASDEFLRRAREASGAACEL